MANFPNIAPPSGFSEKTLTHRTKKKSDSGHTRLRPKGSKPKKEFTLDWEVITSADKATLDVFFDTYQALDFVYTHFETAVLYTVFFEEDDLDFTYVTDGYWQIKLTLAEA